MKKPVTGRMDSSRPNMQNFPKSNKGLPGVGTLWVLHDEQGGAHIVKVLKVSRNFPATTISFVVQETGARHEATHSFIGGGTWQGFNPRPIDPLEILSLSELTDDTGSDSPST